MNLASNCNNGTLTSGRPVRRKEKRLTMVGDGSARIWHPMRAKDIEYVGKYTVQRSHI